MKSQLSFEYFITTALFVVFVVYLIFQVMEITPSFISELKNERIRSEAYQISELLINDPGEPLDWHTTTAKRIGLSAGKTNYLSRDKINTLESNCDANYEDVRNLIDTEYTFNITLTSTTDVLITCEPSIPPTKPIKASITRVVAIDDNSFGSMTLQLW